jgi:hypothetical protein
MSKNERRRTSVLPTEGVNLEALDLDSPWEIATVIQLHQMVKEQPAAVLAMINDLREDRDEGLELAQQQVHQGQEIQQLREQLTETQTKTTKYKGQLREKAARIEQLEILLQQEQHREVTPSSTMDANASKKSTKIPPPPVFSDGESPTWEVWLSAVQEVLVVNADHYPTADAQIAFVCNRVEGKAAEHIQSRRGLGNPNRFNDPNEVLDHLASIYQDHDKDNTYRFKYKHLKMEQAELFSAFYSRFTLIANYLPMTEETKMHDLKDRIVPRLQNALATCPIDFANLALLQAYLQRTDNQQRSLFKQRELEKPVTGAATAKISKTFTARPAVPVRPVAQSTTTITTPVAPNSYNRQISTDVEREQLRKEGKCFRCKQAGHIAPNCPQAKTQIHEMDTNKNNETAKPSENE